MLVADRGLASYVHLALLSLRKMHGLFRCHQNQIVSFRVGRKHTGQRKPIPGLPRSRYVRRLGKQDQVVEYSKPKNRPNWMKADAYAALPETLEVRELRCKVKQRGCRTREITLVTTLLDAEKYPALDVAELYRQRWQIETNFRHLKTTMKMEVLHCKTVDGVLKELCMFAVAYNLVRLAMLEAARRQKKPVDRISFIDALRWLREALAARGESQRADAQADRESVPPRPHRTPRDQTPPQTAQTDQQAASGTPQVATGKTTCGLSSCHSCQNRVRTLFMRST